MNSLIERKRRRIILLLISIIVIAYSAIAPSWISAHPAEPFPPFPPREVGGVLDENAWQPATIMTDEGYMKMFPMDGVPIYYLQRGAKVYVQHIWEGRYFVQYYVDCLDNPISGWMWPKDTVLDIYLVPAK